MFFESGMKEIKTGIDAVVYKVTVSKLKVRKEAGGLRLRFG